MRTRTKRAERFVDESSIEEDMDFSPEESTYLKLIKCTN
jgi:hypothetical protein